MKDTFSAVTGMQLNQAVERILHVPGNFSGGILEMTIVVDCALPQEKRQYVLSKIAFTLKTHSELFKNVRLNVVEWSDDAHMENRVTPLIQLTMSSYYEKIHSVSKEKKHISYLMEYLKKFHARSKVILIVTDGSYLMDADEEDHLRLEQALFPFLGKKFARVLCTGEEINIENRKI